MLATWTPFSPGSGALILYCGLVFFDPVALGGVARGMASPVRRVTASISPRRDNDAAVAEIAVPPVFGFKVWDM